MRRTIRLFCTVLLSMTLFSCAWNPSQSGGSAVSTKSTTPTKTVFTYDGGTIILNDNPPTASVNGQSGRWDYVPNYGRRDWAPQPYYFVCYGDKSLIISEGKGMIYFGSQKDAARDQDKAYKWVEYRKRRE